MGLGKWEELQQQEFWTPTSSLSEGPGHIFYDKLRQVFAKAGFDRPLEALCRPCYTRTGRMSIPLGVYFRMLLVSYFGGIDSQRGIAWPCKDSLLLRRLRGNPLGKETPNHSSLTRIRDRIPLEIHEQVFQQVLSIIEDHSLLKLKAVGVDSTLLGANAAMKTIVRKDSGEDWKAYLKRLMQEEGFIQEADDPSDPDARIIRMKGGRTHLGYKDEHVVDLENEIILSATLHHGTLALSATGTMFESVVNAQRNVILSGSKEEIEEVDADKGYHKNETIRQTKQFRMRTYIPEPNSPHNRTWTDKFGEVKQAVLSNRRRMNRAKGKALQQQCSEKVERSFAHICETRKARRTWLREIEKANKRYPIIAAAGNLGLLMLKVLRIGNSRSLQGGIGAALALRETYLMPWLGCSEKLSVLTDRENSTSKNIPVPRLEIQPAATTHTQTTQIHANFNRLLEFVLTTYAPARDLFFTRFYL
jgi:Transposase domain (DUF772).